MVIKSFPEGLTVKELKEIIADWPEVYADGEPTRIWLETGWCLSSVAIAVSPLNKRGNAADLILSYGAMTPLPQSLNEV